MASRLVIEQRLDQSDDLILNEIWRLFYEDEQIRAYDFHDISVEVQDGQVFLSGHLSMIGNQQRIAEIVHYAPGVVVVHNNLTTDNDLSILVAQALSEDRRTCRLDLRVNSHHGWISLDGEVPNRELQLVVEEVVSQVPSVRGLISSPRVHNEDTNPVLRCIQPRIGVRVYGTDGGEGIVTQVVIQPRNRLVTHAVVRAGFSPDSKSEPGSYLVPVDAMDVVNEHSILFAQHTPALADFPAFLPTGFALPPLTWQPPYPYQGRDVLWFC